MTGTACGTLCHMEISACFNSNAFNGGSGLPSGCVYCNCLAKHRAQFHALPPLLCSCGLAMGFLGLFGGGSSGSKKKSPIAAQPAPEASDAIIRVRETVAILEKKEADLERKIASELDTARAHATTNKSRALLALKRKAAFTAQLSTIQASRMQMEEQALQLEITAMNVETTSALQASLRAQQTLQKKMPVAEVDRLVDDLRDLQDNQRELTDALAALNTSTVGDDELAQELDMIVEERVSEALLEAPAPAADAKTKSTQQAPIASPPPPPPKATAAEDDELEQLRKSLAL